MPLTDTAVRQAKPTGENHTLKDTAGLALFVGAKGAKQRHSRFYWLGKQARLSMSVYPTVSLKHDREARDQARDLVAQGVDPQIDGTSPRTSCLGWVTCRLLRCLVSTCWKCCARLNDARP
ncbi:DUF4102 domain-containing protein [Pseudomonas putida]|uniref:Arm DNA-binding domain-containing protein n=1 Tax=Pseudomonas putida TaxID=303 RepID=UPI0018D9EE6F|nr:DUF4102 domain-containing protein [Pseudomonas putida]